MWSVSSAWLIVTFLYVAGAQSSIRLVTLHVLSEVRHRYAVTLVHSVISNTADVRQEATFNIQLPKEAFISNFTMTIDGVVYPGEVAEKGAAARKFKHAVKTWQTTGLVAKKSSRETNEFTVTAKVLPYTNVIFDLTYHELLQRRAGLYENVIYINPGVIVPDVWVEVCINESREITELTVPEVRGDRLTSTVIAGTNRFAQIERISASAARVTFAPTPEQQRVYSNRGVSGQFIVNYDVDHDVAPEGEILTSNGYFVHFFAPENLPTLGKRIVFVLDVSGSMVGTKIRQLREALVFILDELRPIDEFGIFLFNTGVRTWNAAEMISATPENIRRAKRFARSITAGGETNINAALIRGMSALSEHATKPSMILFLTDGKATVGHTKPARILENVGEARLPKQSIYSLAFGKRADFDLIRKISAQNKGFARRIYEDADASLQLAGFYNEISTPVLSDVRITYLNDTVDPASVTATRYPSFFRGSEIVVTGRLGNVSGPVANRTQSLDVSIEGNLKSSKLTIRRSHIIWPCWNRQRCPACLPGRPCPRCLFVAPCPPRVPSPQLGPILGRNDFIERLWVFLTIKELTKKTLTEAKSSRKASAVAKAEIVRLSLKYNFVTPFTSMVITRPFGERTVLILNETSYQGDIPTRRRQPVARPIGTPRVLHLSPLQSLKSRLGRFGPPSGSFGFRSRLVPSTTTTTTTPSPVFASPAHFAAALNVEVEQTQVGGQTSRGILCLDLATGSPADSPQILLLNDTSNGILLSAVLHSSDYEGFKKFSEIQLTLNDTTAITISTKSIIVGSETFRWWQLRSVNFQGLRITDNDGIELMTSGNLTFVFHKFGLQSRRSLAKPFMTVTAKNTDQLSPSASGLLAGVVDLTNVQQTRRNTLSFTKLGPNGGTRETVTSEGKTLDGERCLRILDPSALSSILDS